MPKPMKTEFYRCCDGISLPTQDKPAPQLVAGTIVAGVNDSEDSQHIEGSGGCRVLRLSFIRFGHLATFNPFDQHCVVPNPANRAFPLLVGNLPESPLVFAIA